MSALHAEVYEAFRVLDVPDDKALRAAVALSAAMTRFENDTAEGFDKRDADIEAIRKDISSINGKVADIDTRLATFQGDMDNRLIAMESKFDKRLTSVQGEVDKRLTSVQGEIDKRLTSVQNDLDRRFVGFQGDMGTRMASMQGEINLLKWMMGTTIALLLTVLFRVFTH